MLETIKKVMNDTTLQWSRWFWIPITQFYKGELELLCDIEVLYGLTILLLMLEEMNNLMKLAQACDQRGASSSYGNYEKSSEGAR